MADRSSRRRQPRIRKAAPTVREKIESGAKAAGPKPRRRTRRTALGLFAPLRLLWRGLRRILSPLAPIGRVLLKIALWLIPGYFLNAWRELKLVTWPNRHETLRLMSAVLVFSIVFGGLVAVVDFGLDQIFRRFVLR